MPLDSNILASISSIAMPQIDEDVGASVRKLDEELEARRQYLRDKYAWGLVAPLSGTRLTYAKKAVREIADPEERQWLINEVNRIAKSQEWAEREEYAKAGFPKRFGLRAQKVGGAFAEAGTGMVEAAKKWKDWLLVQPKSAEDIRFLRGLEAAKLTENPYISADAPLSLKVAAGGAGIAPDLAAGLLAGTTGGPLGMAGYWTARLAPERRESYEAMGLDPAAAGIAGLATAGAEAAIELLQYDPTGITRGFTKPAKQALFRGAFKHPLIRRAVLGAAETLRGYGMEWLEEPLQAGVEAGSEYIASKLYPGAEEREAIGIPRAMVEAGREAAPALVIPSVIGAGGRIPQTYKRFKKFVKGTKRAQIEKQIIEYSNEDKTPSRKTWKEWNLSLEAAKSRKERKEGVNTLAKTFMTLDQVRTIAVNTQPTMEQWKQWNLPEEEGETGEQRLKFLRDQYGVVEAPEAAQEMIPGAPEAEVPVTPEVAPEVTQAIQGAVAQPSLAVTEAARVVESAAPPQEVETPEGIDKTKPGVIQIPAEEAKAIMKATTLLASPAHSSNVARQAAHILRKAGARAAQWTQASEAAMRKVEWAFLTRSPQSNIEFNVKMERGESQETPELDAIAKVIREESAKTRIRVQKQTGKLQEYYQNYFPHLWKHRPGSDVILGRIIGKSFRPTAFLRKRKIPTLEEGLAEGLELVTDNPVRLHMIRIRQMNEFVAKHEAMATLKQDGLARFVPANFEKDYLPSGYTFVDDPAFIVQNTGDLAVEEAYDKLLFDQLISVAKAIGVSHERVPTLAGKGEQSPYGVSYKTLKKIKTKVGAPLSVLAHEIGHQIGDIYGLYDYMVNAHPDAKMELEALAQLRFEEHVPLREFQKYVSTKPEKEAVVLEAWLAAPEKMEQAAPNVTTIWKEFLEKNTHLTPLLMLNRSLVLGTTQTVIEQPGIRVLGRWALPVEIATMIKNHLSPGLRRNENLAVRTGWNLARMFGNAMNQANLSLSAFHGLNVMTDATASTYALGLQQVVRGEYEKGLCNIVFGATQLGPGIKAAKIGHMVMKAMNEDFGQIENPKLREQVARVIKAGGRAFMDTQYHNHAARNLMQTFRDIRFGEPMEKVSAAMRAPVNLVFAGLEITTWPIMQWLVPRLKLGVFSQLAQDIYNRADKENLTGFQVNEQLTQAWDSVDNRMGQLAYDNLFWNQYVKDVSLLAVRSVGWNLGSIREYGGALIDPLTFRQRMARGDQFLSRKMAYAIGAVMTYAPLGAIMTYLMTGSPPEEPKDYFFWKTGRMNSDGSAERLSPPTYAKDWVAWRTDPIRTARHKLHPMWGTLSNAFWNEDYFGTEIRNSDDPWMAQFLDTVTFFAKEFLPFSIRNYSRMREAGEPIGIAVPVAALGIAPAPGYITKTRAQKLATQYIVARLPKGIRDKEKAEAARYRKNLLKRWRRGEEPTSEEVAKLTSEQRQRLIKEAYLTPFQALFDRLTFSEALNVYAQCNEKEKKQVIQIFVGKASRAQSISQDEKRFYLELIE